MKICNFATEERVRNMVNRIQPDLVVGQEFWNNDCSEAGLDLDDDRVCGPKRKANRQDERVLDPSVYDTRCAPREAGGYECISVRHNVFRFSEPSYAVSTFKNPYCELDKTKGSDTGFFAQTVSLVNPLGTGTTSFDVVNAHLATPAPKVTGENNINCRGAQIQAVINAWRTSNRKLIVAGDFNTDVFKTENLDTRALNNLGSTYNSPVNKFPAVRLTYFVSGPNDITAYSVAVAPAKLDHVLSNFTDVAPGQRCARGEQVEGLDHRSTICQLFGFDSGRTRTGLLARDTSGQYPDEFVSSIVTVSRKGAKMPFVKWTGSTIHDITLPDGIETNVELDMKCLYALPVAKTVTVPRGGSASLGTMTISVFRPYCP